MSDLRTWLHSLSLGCYADAFEAGGIDWDVLPELDHEVLKELGVNSPGDRLRILKSVKRLAEAGAAEPAAPAAPPPDSTWGPERPEHGGEAERRQLTVMFCDLVGSTTLSATLDPEDLREVINAFQQCAVQTVEGFGGHVARYMGDAILVYFGYPRADEHDAARAVRAGLAVVDAVSRLHSAGGQRLQTRVGIATGLVVAGDLVESAMTRERTVVGETPNLAARLQSLAAPDQVVVSDVTRRLTRAGFEFADLGVQPVKGFSEPVPLWRAVREYRGAGTGTEFPLVGREREVGLLVDRWEVAAHGDGQVVLLCGQAGMGKTRILAALIEAIGERPHVAVRYFCSPYHANSSLYPVVEQLTRAARISEADAAHVRRRKLESLLCNPAFGASDTLAHTAAEALSRLLGIETPHETGRDLATADQVKECTLDTLVELLCAMSAVAPVIVALEDAQWADPTTRELFDAIAERTQDLPVLLVVTYRGDFEPAWSEFTHVTSLTLNRLGSREVDALVCALCGGRRLPAAVHERIVANTDGVPLFIEELTRGVLESGLLTERAGRYELSGPLPPFAIPATLHDSLMARLDRLDTAKELAQTGAAIGRSFARGVLEAVAELPPADVEQALDRLEHSGLLMRRGRGAEAQYTFKHALMQEVAHQSLLRSRRQILHMRIAGVLAQRFPDMVASQPELLARQYSEAGIADQAAASWLEAAYRAKRLAAYSEAESHVAALLEACAELGDTPEGRAYHARAHALRGDLESLHGLLENANDAYEKALAAAPDPAFARDVQSRLHRVRETSRNGARIVYYVHGDGEQTLLFVNPIAYGLAMFQPVLERLCHEFRVVTVDCRGAGRSDPIVRPYSIEQHVRDTAAVIDDLGVGPVIGVGVSRGGNQLIRLGAERPELLKAAVLIGTPFRVGSNTAIQADSRHARAQLEALALGNWDHLHEAFARSLYTEASVRHLARQFAASCAGLPRETMRSFFDGDPKLDVSGLLSAIEYPVLITHGEEDQRVAVDNAHDFHAAIAGSMLHLFAGKGHLPVFSAPEEFCAVLRGFVRDRVEPGGAKQPRRPC